MFLSLKKITTIKLSVSLIMMLNACSSDGTADAIETNENGLEGVSLTSNISQWTDTTIRIDYTLSNDSALELIVFDVDEQLVSHFENDGVILLKGKLSTPNIDFAVQPTIGGRNLSPGQSITGSGSSSLPLEFLFTTPAVDPISPESVEFCIGYGNADMVIPTTRPDGLFTFNTDLDLQTLSCVMLERP